MIAWFRKPVPQSGPLRCPGTCSFCLRQYLTHLPERNRL